MRATQPDPPGALPCECMGMKKLCLADEGYHCEDRHSASWAMCSARAKTGGLSGKRESGFAGTNVQATSHHKPRSRPYLITVRGGLFFSFCMSLPFPGTFRLCQPAKAVRSPRVWILAAQGSRPRIRLEISVAGAFRARIFWFGRSGTPPGRKKQAQRPPVEVVEGREWLGKQSDGRLTGGKGVLCVGHILVLSHQLIN